MVFTPGIGDVAIVVQAAHWVYSSLKSAPEEFSEIAGEVKDLESVLKQIDKQARDPWSPLCRHRQSAVAIGRAVTACKAQLEDLSSKLEKYNSLGDEQPKAIERVRYITHDFVPIRDAIRQRRVEIDTQLNLCQTGQLGQITRILMQMNAEEHAGLRREVLIDEDATDDDVMSTLSADYNVPAAELQAHRDNIREYISEARKRAGDGESWVELSPSDSASHVGESSAYDGLHALRDLRIEEIKSSFPGYRGSTIQSVSNGTIMDPHRTSGGVRKSGTFDVWELASMAIHLQIRLSKGVSGAGTNTGFSTSILDRILENLLRLQPILLLFVADSSTDEEFWTRIDRDRRLDLQLVMQASSEYSSGQSWPFDLSITALGATLIEILRALESRLDAFEEHQKRLAALEQHPPSSSLAPPASRNSRFSLSLRRSRSADSRKTTAEPTGLIQRRWRFEMISGEHIRISNADECVWALEKFGEAFVSWTSVTFDMPKTDFLTHLQAIDHNWQVKYAGNSGMVEGGVPARSPILMEWLAGAQKLEHQGLSTIQRLAGELQFSSQSRDLSDTNQWCNPSYLRDDRSSVRDMRTGLDITTDLAEAFKVNKRAVWPHNPTTSMDPDISALDHEVCPENRLELPEGWEPRMTLQRQRFYVEPGTGAVTKLPPPQLLVDSPLSTSQQRRSYKKQVAIWADCAGQPKWSIAKDSPFY